ncbi:TetR/AcrR family transcriptional regulator C-terminal domain-containing protein [Actinomadura sp. DC4]|uniref:TetR/AcrR family transcriptional regulator C-terminal domain-containing protein n=1 Tax=Actinomadura sp. DC4 TaxID=3055069 RepID=UPI0025AF6D87|nr:TetR/AcrR family transcriptional regulator C-terminal domain-containing protein [Actinomadura sp. DC4]MDN3356013.1 TetR/AcrR family transcriptional regulator C-terminal domain-containing protein [Actinomadura sp. DC4]
MTLWTDADESTEQPRVPLSRRRVLRAAVGLADRDGLDALTMRRLAQEVGVEAMSLYHHVANKEAVFDGVVEVILGEIMAAVDGVEAPSPEEDWQAALRARILAAREVFLRHRWAPQVLETRTTTSPFVIAYFDHVIAILRAGGFSFDLAHRALHVLGSRALGFAQELFQPDSGQNANAEAAAMMEQMADRFPNIVGMLADAIHDDPDGTLGFCDDQFEFEFALDLILEGLERRRAATA